MPGHLQIGAPPNRTGAPHSLLGRTSIRPSYTILFLLALLVVAGVGLAYADGPALISEAHNESASGDNGGAAEVTGTANANAARLFISDIQGNGPMVALSGVVTVEAIVTSLFEVKDALAGFFLQEEDADHDGDASTSEGIFVFCSDACPVGLAVGDQVIVTGTAGDFHGMSQIDAADPGNVTINSSGNPLPAPTRLSLPASGSTQAEETFENTEGMVVEFRDRLVVSEYFRLPQSGQLVLTDGTRPYQFTQGNAPSVSGYAAFLDDLATRRIILDDGSSDRDDAISGPARDEAYPYPEGGLSNTNRFRGGDSIIGLAGVMHWSFGAWRIQPVPEKFDYSFTADNRQSARSENVGGSLRVAGFNVLNYFTTINSGLPSCGPAGDQDCRGANSAAELVRQRDKIVAALVAIDADIVGVIEIENNSSTSLIHLVDGLNTSAGTGTYAYVDTGTIGSDAIKVGLIYRAASVMPAGSYAILDSSVDPAFVDTKNRPTLIQTFEEVASGERFTVAVNHLKSKGSDCDSLGDPDLGDGQANCSQTRTSAAGALARYLTTDPTGSGDPDILIIGDLNAYAREDPITALETAGYTDLVEAFVGSDAYSFVFGGQLGYLDHALASPSLLGQVTGAAEWHINADEVAVFDYNDGVHDPDERFWKSTARPVYEPNAFRSSDHDPVIVGLDLGKPTRDPVDGGDRIVTVESEPEQPDTPTTRQVTVKAGDYLRRIAMAYLGDGNRWPEIYELNKGVTQADGRSLTNPDLIHIGWLLEIPAM